MSNIKSYFDTRVVNFQAGTLKYFTSEWESITTDVEVLSTVSGLPLEFLETTPGFGGNYENFFSADEHQFVLEEVSKLLKKGVIKECVHEVEEFISPIFLTSKSDGSYRLIKP